MRELLLAACFVVVFCSAVDPEPQVVDPTPLDEFLTSATVVGGQFNRWYNITSAIIVPGAEDPSFGDYTCNVCFLRGTPFEECHNATMQLHILGAPPMLVRSDGELYQRPSKDVVNREAIGG